MTIRTTILASVAALALMGAAKADTTTFTSPGNVLTSDIDHVTVTGISYDSDGKVTGTFRVTKNNGQVRAVNARFANAGAAYAYAAAVNAQAGGYDVTNPGTGIVVKTSPKNLKALPDGVAGIVVQHGPAYVVGGGTWGTVTMTTRYNTDGSCQGYCGGDKAPAPAVQNAKSSSSKGGNYGHAAPGNGNK